MESLIVENLIQSFLKNKRLNVLSFIFFFILIYSSLILFLAINHEKAIYKYSNNYDKYIKEVNSSYKSILEKWSPLNNFFNENNNLSFINYDFPTSVKKDLLGIKKIIPSNIQKYDLYFNNNELNIIFYLKDTIDLDEKFDEFNTFIKKSLDNSINEYLEILESNILDKKKKYNHLIKVAAQCFKLSRQQQISDFCNSKDNLLKYEFFYVEEIKQSLISFQDYKLNQKSFLNAYDFVAKNHDNFQIDFEERNINYFDKFHLKILFALVSTFLILLILNYTLAIINLLKSR